MLFSLNFLQQKISPRPKTVQKGEAIASNGISLLYILSDSCKKCGKSKVFFFFRGPEVFKLHTCKAFRCLTQSNFALLSCLLNLCSVLHSDVLTHRHRGFIFWKVPDYCGLILLRGRFSQNLFRACFSCCCYISAKSSSNGCRSCYFSAIQHFLAP